MDPEAKQLLAEPQAVHPLDPSKNPLLISIFDACDTMKTLVARGQLTAEVVRDAKAMLMLRLDKVQRGTLFAFSIVTHALRGMQLGHMP